MEVRTPLKAITNSSFCVGSAGKSFAICSASKASISGSATKLGYDRYCSVGSSEDLLQSRIEHLERERVELSLQLHQKDEKERSRNILIRNLESTKEELDNCLESSKKEILMMKSQKESLEREVSRLSSQVEASQGMWAKVNAATREVRRCEEELLAARKEVDDQAAEKEKSHRELFKLRLDMQKASTTISGMTTQIAELEAAEAEHATQSSLQQQEIAALKKSIEDLKSNETDMKTHYEEKISRFNWEAELLKAKLLECQQELLNRSQSCQSIQSIHTKEDSHCESNNDQEVISELQERLKVSEQLRRKLHNQLQEMRGNIRVFVRCRPFLKGDEEYAQPAKHREGCLQFCKDGVSLNIVTSQSTSTKQNNYQQFVFDNVFQPESTQTAVYEEVREFIQSALDGYRVCIFSYGQTGSGKTHTMAGEQSGDHRGIIPRAVEQVLQQVHGMKEQGWTVQITASMVELYNEELRDLLLPASTKDVNRDKLKIHYQNGRVTIQGLTTVELYCDDVDDGLDQLRGLLNQSAKTRSTASTAMNDQSSRSHALFLLDLVCRHSDGTTVMTGGLRLCDLAGSERLDRTGTLNDAARLRETVNINKSLSCLADVFLALSSKSSHVPYRNSKLTMMLQDCLSGDGKSLMIVNASPTVASHQETLCSLRFASQVNKVELGKACRNIFVTSLPGAPQPPPPLPPALNGGSVRTRSTASPSMMLQPPARPMTSRAATAPATSSTAEDSSFEIVVKGSGDASFSSETESKSFFHPSTHSSATCTFLNHSIAGVNAPSKLGGCVRRASVLPVPAVAGTHKGIVAGDSNGSSTVATGSMTRGSKRISIMPPSSSTDQTILGEGPIAKRMRALQEFKQANASMTSSAPGSANNTSKLWR